jgi:MerR family transcriptional regulator/heat shock protein HspR
MQDDADALRGARSDDQPVYVISVAAELSGVHPQTLRMYERRGLLARAPRRSRRYSERDIERVRVILELTRRDGISLAGVRLFFELREQLEQMHRRTEALERQLLDRLREGGSDIVPLRSLMTFTWEREPEP